MSRLKVNIVGHGRLGSTVAPWLREVGHHVVVVGRRDTIPPADVTWLTVPDTEIAAAAGRCPRVGVLLHASGASELDVLGDHARPGSLHPLMTFPGIVRPEYPIPAAISGGAEAQDTARQLAESMGWSPFTVTGNRAAYHAAAVMAGNFATTLLADAAAVMAMAGVPLQDAPALLAPLALQSLRNAASIGPARALTGPVVRGDEAVVASHRAVLQQAAPEIVALYEQLLQNTRKLVQARNSAAQPAAPDCPPPDIHHKMSR